MCKIISCLVCIIMLAGMASGETLIWSDEFDGSSVNTANWGFDTGGGGWGNSELQIYQTANATVSNGNLIIEVRKETNGDYTSARLKTIGKVQFQYGHLVARIMPANIANGLWPAFWTLGASGKWPNCGEVDIWEMGAADAISGGVVNRRVYSAAHWEHNNRPASYGLSYDAPSDLYGSYHTMEMTWTPSFINTYIDGHMIWEIDITSTSCTDCTEFHQPHYVLLNCAVGGSFTGYVNPPTAPLPAKFYIDYVRLYDNGYTTNVTIPGGGGTTETNCTDGVDNDGDGQIDCADSDCSADPACGSSCLAKGAACTTNSECCSNKCVRSKCL